MRPARIGFVWVGLLAALGLSGCLTLEVRTRVDADGSVERTVVVAVDAVLLRTVPWDPFEPLRTGAEAAGWRVEPYQDAARGQEGLRLRRTFEGLEALNRLQAGDPLAGLERVEVASDGDLRVVTVTLSVAGILDRLRIAAGEPPFSPEDLALLRAAEPRFFYELELSGPILDYTPRRDAQVEGRRIRWAVSLSPDQPAVRLSATWRPVRAVPNCLGGLIGLLIGGGAALALIAAGRGARGP